MKKLMLAFAVGLSAVSFGGPRGGFGGPGGHRPPPPMHRHGHHHGSRFWGGFSGALVGTAVGTAISAPFVASDPIVVSPPPPPPFVPVASRVWIPPRTVTGYDTWGRPYSYVIPGRWEYR